MDAIEPQIVTIADAEIYECFQRLETLSRNPAYPPLRDHFFRVLRDKFNRNQELPGAVLAIKKQLTADYSRAVKLQKEINKMRARLEKLENARFSS
jgi:hypothetical protein